MCCKNLKMAHEDGLLLGDITSIKKKSTRKVTEDTSTPKKISKSLQTEER